MNRLLHMCPEYASADLADVELREFEMLGDAPLRPAVSFESADASDDLLVDRGVAVRFTFGFVHEAKFPGSAIVLFVRYVFKILCAVVRFVSVYVVNFSSSFGSNEGTHYDIVDEGWSACIVFTQANSQVTFPLSAHLTGSEDVPDLSAVPVQASDATLIANFVQSSVSYYREPRLFRLLHAPIRTLFAAA